MNQVDLRQSVERIKLGSFAPNTFGYSSEFLSSLHLNPLPHRSAANCIVSGSGVRLAEFFQDPGAD